MSGAQVGSARAGAGGAPSALLRRAWPGLGLSVLALALAGWLRAHSAAALALFHAGDVLGTTSSSQIDATDLAALLGHAQLLLLGAGALLLAPLVRRLLRHVSGTLQRRAALAPLALIVTVCCALGAYALWQRSSVVGGQRFFYLKDDAMTSMVYARQLVQGHGLVYNVGERVEGYSNLLWVLWMAGIHALGAGVRLAPGWVMASAWACVACSVAFLVDLLRALRASRGWLCCVALCVLADQNTWTWAASGLETSALTAAVSACAWALVRRRRGAFATGLVLVTLLRSDGFVLALALGGVGVWRFGAALRAQHGWVAASRPLWPAALAALLLFACRGAYYDYAFPNTYYLKMIGLGDRLSVGFGSYGVRMAHAYPLVLGLVLGAALVAWAPPLERALAGLVLFQASYALYVGGDSFEHLRFFAPVLPLCLACAARFLERLLAQPQGRGAPFGQALLLGVCPVPCEAGQLGQLPDESGFFESELSLARLLERNVPAGSLVTVYPAGTLPYYAPGLRYLDVFGKTDAHIAHQSTYAGTAIGHNKSDFDYVYATRKPDVAFVLSPCDVIDQYVRASDAERERLQSLALVNGTAVRFLDIAHPSFQRDYYPGRVSYAGFPSPTPPECVFVRRGSGISQLWDVPR